MKELCYVLAAVSGVAALFVLFETSPYGGLGFISALPLIIGCFLWIVIATILKNQERILLQLKNISTPTATPAPLLMGDSVQKAAETYASELMRVAASSVDDSLGKAKVVVKSVTACPDNKNAFIVKCDFVSGSRTVSATSKMRHVNDGHLLGDWSVETPDFA